ILTLNGNTIFRNASSTDFEVQLNGTTPGTGYDQLVIDGSLELTGDLEVTLGYTPAVGESFTIINNASTNATTGAFNGLSEGSLFSVGSQVFSITYQGGTDSNDVVLTRVLAGEWDGGGTDDNWTTAENWVGDIVPAPYANLIFPNSAARKSNINDFSAGMSIGSILISGSSYSLSGNPINLTGSVSSNAFGNAFSIPVQLGSAGGFSSASSTFTVSSAIDTNGQDLNLGSSGGTLLMTGVISGSGNLNTSGSSTVALAGNNSYTGETRVGGGILAVQHDHALGSGDNMAATGTSITGTNSYVQLENGVTISNERLTSATSTTLFLNSTGNNLTNTWTGDIVSGNNSQVYLRPLSSNNRLQLDGTVATAHPSYQVIVQGTSTGITEINGTLTANRLYVSEGTAELNGTSATTNAPYVDSSFGDRLSGTGTFNWTNTSSTADIYGNLNPGGVSSTGILTLNGNTIFRNASSTDFEVQLNGT
ncbi:MAG: hypothetical protein KDB23_31915, partial [Planctomycetales bacterium]|nr:hypothetical protein [Planctomycetales bacterium]